MSNQHTASKAPIDRPAEFDARVIAYIPGLRRLAWKLGWRGEDVGDMAIEAVIVALSRWHTYREDGKFWPWLYFIMRGVSRDRRAKKSISIAEKPLDDDFGWAIEAPRQEGYAELSKVLSGLQNRAGGILLRRAMGDGLREIGEDLGVGRERVRQLEMQARAELRAAS